MGDPVRTQQRDAAVLMDGARGVVSGAVGLLDPHRHLAPAGTAVLLFHSGLRKPGEYAEK